MPASDDDWSGVVQLIDAVMSDDDLVPTVIGGVRQLVREVSALPPADMAGQTRALMAAATRAVAGRRGPTEAELSFVEDLATTRAGQGIPIEVVLGAIHVSERAIWGRARELAEQSGLDPARLLDARDLYDDWAEAVRARLIRAHREARSHGSRGVDRELEVVRRLLEGGTAAGLAAAEAGFAPGRPVWVLAARGADAERLLHRVAGGRPATWRAPLEAGVVAVSARPPTSRDDLEGVVGCAGPVPVEEVGPAHRLASATIDAARAAGRTGLVMVADVAVPLALLSRTDLTSTIEERHRAALERLGPQASPVAEAVLAWLHARRDTAAAAASLYVHPNTVRNRVQRFQQVTGLDTAEVLDAAQAWWLCTTWLHAAADAP
ncbi:helix-turn-helix domain-containing protein [Aeromicrobium massiliense]|uniref:helix-turn-helix domain-containing protein n=1 Tax=Aeromicrobium massiliense TaxID=1464554 RepID=UPI0005785A8A|nr:helix-turn-helix domain-containing protein [Aeromicrobium massiliense]